MEKGEVIIASPFSLRSTRCGLNSRGISGKRGKLEIERVV